MTWIISLRNKKELVTERTKSAQALKICALFPFVEVFARVYLYKRSKNSNNYSPQNMISILQIYS